MSISKERLKKIETLKDKDIDYSDIPETDEAFWEKAELRMPRPKKAVYLRLDQDLLDWLKRQGPGYQTRINAILRSYMETRKAEP
ncbi:MAG: BrnA antitoxin family protein [Gammaproteobacteria bacterium]